MNLRDIISNLHPDLAKKYNSIQYELSQSIIEKKLELNVTQKKMSEMMEVGYEEYFDMEKGSMSIPVEYYKKALNQLDANIIKKKSEVNYPNYNLELIASDIKRKLSFSNDEIDSIDLFNSISDSNSDGKISVKSTMDLDMNNINRNIVFKKYDSYKTKKENFKKSSDFEYSKINVHEELHPHDFELIVSA